MQSTNLINIAGNLKQVLKTSTSYTDTISQTFIPQFTVTSFINNSLLQPTLHANHLLREFVDITNPLLSTAALLFRFHNHRIQIWADKAASYLARWILRSYVQYAVKIGSNYIFQDSQGGVQGQVKNRYDIFVHNFRWKQKVKGFCTSINIFC